jgi:hypothetical protein
VHIALSSADIMQVLMTSLLLCEGTIARIEPDSSRRRFSRHGCQVQQTPQQTWPGAPRPQTYGWGPWSAGAPPPQTHGWSPWSGGAPQHPAGWPQQGWPGEGSSQGHGDAGSQPDQ